MSNWAHFVYCIGFFIAAMTAFNYRRMAKKANDVTTETLGYLEHSQSVAKTFDNAARLIAIHRNGRMNVFTFARGHEIFMIETMGVMSDEPDVWRKQAGLSP
jgi:hypothetical protein